MAKYILSTKTLRWVQIRKSDVNLAHPTQDATRQRITTGPRVDWFFLELHFEVNIQLVVCSMLVCIVNRKNTNEHLTLLMTLSLTQIQTTAELTYSYIVYSRFFTIVEFNLVPFAFISLLFYPCYSRLLFQQTKFFAPLGSTIGGLRCICMRKWRY